ncbi:tRNA(Ile)-lysidine synthetase [Coriobacterium glomerans PW2]|uniref:tRNA(Ile)-lysidine synthase n=1 Tax=Coriobacterium glomerans (strain ATCC 49209 / DSM 20642 / JCM 10262 / PW2) TaxID=700015 RepID=F2N6X8_CORGP|nr:tRNA lysidine(34) synthetase TilS [Coriobacterium glomerans]AEB06177.1 tRNA(Ile)-lysidine synthetase [Coriobacterium glomerans PW2]
MPTVSQRTIQSRARIPSSARAPKDDSVPPVVLMVSGGADSTALLLMACTSKLDIDDGCGRASIARNRLHVLHVNHHLRGSASDGDEAFVRELCRRLGVPVCVEHASLRDLGGRNLEAAARDVRYAAARRYLKELVEEAGCPRRSARIATAHTANDRAETFFMNAIRGSGISGLSSIPRRRNLIVRPLIDRTHEELQRYLEVAGLRWREDESNRDTSFLRNYVRHRLMPVAMERNRNLVRTVAASCDILADEDAYMQKLAATALRSCTRREGAGLLVLNADRLAATQIALARRMVRLAVKRIDPQARLEMDHVQRVLECVAAGERSITLPGGISALVEFGTLTFRVPAPLREPTPGWLPVPGKIAITEETAIEVEPISMEPGSDPIACARRAAPAVLVDAASLGYGEADLPHGMNDNEATGVGSMRLWVDTPVPGDVMCPLGMHGRSKKLSDIFGADRVPVEERSRVPVVRTAPTGAVVWVAGVRLDDRFRCTPTTKVALRISVRGTDKNH